MVQRKTCQAIKSYNFQSEIRLGQEHPKNLGPEMMMMKKTTKLRKKVTVSQSSKLPKHDLVAKLTGGSPNYMKGTSSSEARKEKNKKRFNLSWNQKNQKAGLKERCNNNKPSSRVLIKAPSFKRCSQRATCSSTLKDSKFPEFLMLNHGGKDDEVCKTSVLKVCSYSYCSLNGHLHSLQYSSLKSFISSKRRSFKSRKTEASKDLEEDGNGETFEVENQTSETVSEEAPCSETSFDGYSDISEKVKLSEDDHGGTDKMKNPEKSETGFDDYSDISEMVKLSEDDHGGIDKMKNSETSETGSDISEMMKFSEDDHGGIKNSEANTGSEEEDGNGETFEVENQISETSFDGYSDISKIVKFSEDDHGGMKNTEVNTGNEEEDDADKTRKVQIRKPCNKEEESDVTISWNVKRKKPIVETEDLRGFNPKEPNYLPIVEEEDAEKVDLKHQDMDERKNSEDWMFDYALQRVVTKLSSQRKRKVALLVEAFETVKPAPVLSYGRHLQACN